MEEVHIQNSQAAREEREDQRTADEGRDEERKIKSARRESSFRGQTKANQVPCETKLTQI